MLDFVGVCALILIAIIAFYASLELVSIKGAVSRDRLSSILEDVNRHAVTKEQMQEVITALQGIGDQLTLLNKQMEKIESSRE